MTPTGWFDDFTIYRDTVEDLHLRAGFGPISNGVPLPIGDGGESERELPPPPPASRPMRELDKTLKFRRTA